MLPRSVATLSGQLRLQSAPFYPLSMTDLVFLFGGTIRFAAEAGDVFGGITLHVH